MVNSVGTTGCAAGSASSSAAVGALNGRIRDDKMQLDDWTTCVSAKTVKGQAEIQRLSGQISAEREEVARVRSVGASAADQVSALPHPSQPPGAYGPSARFPGVRGSSIDVWA
jgi:hypothetical protein